jgi:pyruvate-ferredoxin/flavodoxin oxidoreductase
MLLASEQIRERLMENIEALQEGGIAAAACEVYLSEKDNPEKTKEVSEQLVESLKESTALAITEKDTAEKDDLRALADEVIQSSEYLSKKSYWAFGGDGWAYDIGYGGLDHVLASGKDINMLVLDTEVYSNTGGQSSKSTAVGAVAKFASSGKREKKKDLGMMAMSYGYVYVAQVAMGADQNQLLKAMKEAEAYPGPSLVIAYCPCIEHGLKSGMGCSQLEMKKAVECGYWHLYRYNPLLKEEGKNPFVLDSKEPNWGIREFLEGENRYASLKLAFPEITEKLYAKAERDLKERYDSYVRLAKG